MHINDAEEVIICWIKERPQTGPTSHGYDVYVPNVIRHYVAGGDAESRIRELSPTFYDAAWELCRRGILRPGVSDPTREGCKDGYAGAGYSVTPFGQTWARESTADDYVPTEPQRFAKILEPSRARFGPIFHERAQEAVRCYMAHAYLACCAMCGAAAETVLLTAAVAKFGEDEASTLYSAGRSRLQTRLLGQASEDVRRDFEKLSSLLTYWRNGAAHGRTANIGDAEAYVSLATLIRLARFVDERWESIVGSQ